MQAVDNRMLAGVARQIREQLKASIESL